MAVGVNCLANLRGATRRQNNQNKRPYKRSEKYAHLPPGVYPSKKRFAARIRIDGIMTNLGTFDTPTEASAAFIAQAIAIKGEYYHDPRKDLV
jgi:hypothetical protein